ncbi:hypothetical protein EYF80_002277 [Liparis tanakae]|uniref:Uncharacterized protein n=1 Tax=Liparis tanakae TaxID=230148 RepID=A0A4Z2JBP3_9TELE|nr:hypothetical protein EYF80_002277 [Liparis tanakae]
MPDHLPGGLALPPEDRALQGFLREIGRYKVSNSSSWLDTMEISVQGQSSKQCNFSYLSCCCFVRSPLFRGLSLIHGWKQPWQCACLCKMHISARGGE